MTRGPMFTDRDVFESMLREISAADGTHYQDVCPACRRRLVVQAQSARVGGFG